MPGGGQKRSTGFSDAWPFIAWCSHSSPDAAAKRADLASASSCISEGEASSKARILRRRAESDFVGLARYGSVVQ